MNRQLFFLFSKVSYYDSEWSNLFKSLFL